MKVIVLGTGLACMRWTNVLTFIWKYLSAPRSANKGPVDFISLSAPRNRTLNGRNERKGEIEYKTTKCTGNWERQRWRTRRRDRHEDYKYRCVYTGIPMPLSPTRFQSSLDIRPINSDRHFHRFRPQIGKTDAVAFSRARKAQSPQIMCVHIRFWKWNGGPRYT